MVINDKEYLLKVVQISVRQYKKIALQKADLEGLLVDEKYSCPEL